MINNRIEINVAKKLAENEIERVLSSSPGIIKGYISHLLAAKGKFLRATSLLICAQNSEGFIHENAVKLAAAVEILHLATLVHDDVIDNADKRRGIITLQKKYGKRTAVICGDYLLCVALKLASSVSEKENYLNMNIPDYMSRVCLGELNEHLNNYNLDLSVYKYLKIISGKTAALFEASFYAGAVLCGVDKEELSKYMRLGRYIGMIFQLTDDCMDFDTTEDVAKKPVQSDYEQGVITLPLIHVLSKTDSLKEKAKGGRLTREEITSAVKSLGGIDFTRFVAKKYYNKSKSVIYQLKANEDKKAMLENILDKSYLR